MDVRFYPAPPASVGSCSLPTDPSCLSSLDYYHSNKVNDKTNKQTKYNKNNCKAAVHCLTCLTPPATQAGSKNATGRAFAHSAHSLYRTEIGGSRKSQVSASKSGLICGCTVLNVVKFVITPLWNLQSLCFFSPLCFFFSFFCC